MKIRKILTDISLWGTLALNGVGYSSTHTLNNNINSNNCNKEKNALVIIANPNTFEDAFENLDKNIKTIQSQYNTYVDTVSNKREYFQAFEKGREALKGNFDYIYEAGHGNPKGVLLSKSPFGPIGNDIYSESFEGKELSDYFNPSAYGAQASCSAADSTINNNYVQAKANSMQIPIVGMTDKGYVDLTYDSLTDSLIFIGLKDEAERKKGMCPAARNIGYFENEGKEYLFYINDSTYYSINMDNSELSEKSLPVPDHILQNTYYYLEKPVDCTRVVYPK